MEKVVAKLVAAGITPNELQELIFADMYDLCDKLKIKGYGFDVLVTIIILTKLNMKEDEDFQECLLDNIYKVIK